jgi:hypothetical protein
MRTPLALAVAGAVITSGAMLALAGPAGAATTTGTKAATTLSMTESAASVVPGHKDVIDGVLLSGTTPQAAKTVGLYRYDAKTKRWARIAVGRTDTAGKAAFTIRPAKSADYRLAFHGTMALASSQSAAATITVARLTTVLSVTESAPSVTAGSPDVITGVLTTGMTPQKHRTVELYRYDATTKKWLRVDAARSNASGTVSFAVTPSSTTSYRLAFHGTMVLAPAHSATVTVTV